MDYLKYQIFAILIIIGILIINNSFIYESKNNNNKNIYTFWEPKSVIPGFIKLCIRTWEKFLPEYKIIILDFETVSQYIGETLFAKIICTNLSVMVQTDAIRVAILNKYGGIWIDADTIILNDKIIKKFQNYELGMIWEEKINFHH